MKTPLFCVEQPGSRDKRASGITLIEMLVVIVIITIIASISIPAFINIGRGQGMRHTVSTVFNHLSLARQWAITHREMVEFHYDSGGAGAESTFWIVVPRDGGTNLTLVNVTTNSLGIDFNGAIGFIKFKTDGGLATGATAQQIVIRDRDSGQTSGISINGLTGAITVN